jgi:hypothetical protein
VQAARQSRDPARKSYLLGKAGQMNTFGQKQPGYEKRHVANSGDACIGKKLLHLGEHFPVEAKVVSHGIGIGLVIRASIHIPSQRGSLPFFCAAMQSDR